jgi:hypothetical protein
MSTLYARQRKAFKDADEFIRQLRGFGNVEMRPDPNSKKQIGVAEDVNDGIVQYEEATREFLKVVDDARKEMKEVEAQVQSEPIRDLDEFNTAQVAEVAVGITYVEALRPALVKRYDAGLTLIKRMTRAITLGVIRPADGLAEKLKECQEENRVLSKQIAEYKREKLGAK